MDILNPITNFKAEQSLTLKRDRRPFSEKSCPCVKRNDECKPHPQKKRSKQIRCLKMKTTYNLHLNVEIVFLQTYSGIPNISLQSKQSQTV